MLSYKSVETGAVVSKFTVTRDGRGTDSRGRMSNIFICGVRCLTKMSAGVIFTKYGGRASVCWTTSLRLSLIILFKYNEMKEPPLLPQHTQTFLRLCHVIMLLQFKNDHFRKVITLLSFSKPTPYCLVWNTLLNWLCCWAAIRLIAFGTWNQ